MIVYKDVISGDELFSDSYPMKVVNELYYEVEGKVIQESADIDEALIGGNKATEAGEEDEGVDPNIKTGINIVLTHKLIEVPYDKASFKDWLKEYMKKVEENTPNRVGAFQTGMQDFAKAILKDFDNYKFYIGESSDYEAMVILQGYRDDQTTPYFIFFKDGIQEEKY